ncbi:glycosyltransferase, partial [uncultured Muribaculum sp.]
SKAIFLNESDISFMKSNKLLEYDKIEIFDGGEGVDIDRYAPCKELVEHSYFKVVMVSRVLKTKGFHEFVQAAKFSKDAGLDIQYFLAGGIDEIHPDRISRQEIEQAQKNEYFHYMGHLKNLPEFLKDADCVVLPSYYNEGMNRSLMEALSMGIPIVTTDNRGCKELVLDGKTGFIIPSRNAEALFDAILKLYHLDKENMNRMRENSRKYAIKRFDVKNVIQSYIQILDNVLNYNKMYAK